MKHFKEETSYKRLGNSDLTERCWEGEGRLYDRLCSVLQSPLYAQFDRVHLSLWSEHWAEYFLSDEYFAVQLMNQVEMS